MQKQHIFDQKGFAGIRTSLRFVTEHSRVSQHLLTNKFKIQSFTNKFKMYLLTNKFKMYLLTNKLKIYLLTNKLKIYLLINNFKMLYQKVK